jgi:hypothetical protein
MGDSYSGIITPILVQEISDGKKTWEKRIFFFLKKKKVFCIFLDIFLKSIIEYVEFISSLID